MAQAEFSLKEQDRKRFIQDRLIRLVVTCGGVSVLGALVLIFVYLAIVVAPIFSDANIEPADIETQISVHSPVAIGVNEYGDHAYTFDKSGSLSFWSLTDKKPQPEFTQKIAPSILFARSDASSGWLASVDAESNITLFKPVFSTSINKAGRYFDPDVEFFNNGADLSLFDDSNPLSLLGLSAQPSSMTLVGQASDRTVSVLTLKKGQGLNQEKDAWLPQRFTFPTAFPTLDQILVTPNGQQLFLRSGSELMIAMKRGEQFRIREIVDLTQGDPQQQVKNIDLLSGAYSVLVTYSNGLVSQWFDVLQNEVRSLTHIRNFQLAPEVDFLLPDIYRKGFYSFYQNGTLQSHYTTSEKLVLFERPYSKSPDLAAMSKNEKHLLVLSGQQLNVAKVNNDFPEISFSSLWNKVWYESYPEPEYVWQSTSASDEFEEKFSLVPIAFGTLKAAVFAMIFAVPIAVLGAIYTAYFMSPSMRRVVKPTIELMEALPTVIIGFLAGLWFAPIVETHLTAVMALLIILPLTTLVAGGLWHCVPQAVTRRLPNGWHAVILIPALLISIVTVFLFGTDIETILFAGDVKLFLSSYGIDFDQRNALVVGFAMGFAVIPTIFTIAEDAIFSVPKHLSDGSLALGATPWQTLLYVVLLTASPGIFSAVMMGLGRAVGETMIVLMATGNTPIMDWNIFEGMRTLSATIAVELPESEVGSSHYRLLFLAALLLFIFTFAVNALAEVVRQRLRDKYRAL
ncbi:ABC transporter permease subunit [Vibrio genomosp. F6]|uniref:Phosphate ABC transporter permease n=1 Tax=Vibrio genomosp. F6 str. FF-238 TaxID=1191298 RepID=A0A1E5CY42_9VIBR|nr:ABC transporter permease subunit [Vibrio genomosp. F6]OEE75755.1 phosphate ABC transporter permease [Vibrio genomosp. F6 str. FF-238]